MKYFVKCGAEMMVKSKPVKNQMIKNLFFNLKQSLKSPEIKIHKDWEKIIIETQDSTKNTKIEEVLKNTSGIHHSIKVITEDFFSFEKTGEKCLEIYAEKLLGKTFAVRVKRIGEHSFSSVDLEKYLGGYLIRRVFNTKVDLKKPDYTVFLELRDLKVFYEEKRIKGLNGFPLQKEEKVLSLISGGYDSAVSSFLMMKKGYAVDFLFFNIGGEQQKKEVLSLVKFLQQKFSVSYPNKIIIVPFFEIVKNLNQTISSKNRMIILKKTMFKIADFLLEKTNHLALVTGESLGQVSSQTLTNLSIIDEGVSSSVFRPLLTYDKEQIIALADFLNTSQFNTKEYCAITSFKPSAKANKKEVLAEEKKIDPAIIFEAINNKEEFKVSDFNFDLKEKVKVYFEKPNNSIIIDIRDNKEKTDFADLCISYLDLEKTLPKIIKKDKLYLFYCDDGYLSRNMVERFFKKNIFNLAVFQK
jgi:thiamine biosynthesis protein ThiI